MTLEQFDNLKVGDTFYFYSIMRNKIISPKIIKKTIMSLHTDVSIYFKSDTDKIYLSAKECKIDHIKKILSHNGNIDEYTDFIKENVEYFI